MMNDNPVDLPRTLDNCDSLYEILKICAHHKSSESLDDSFSERIEDTVLCDYFKMMAISDKTVALTGMASDPFGHDILEDGGRISLAYENLRSIPKRIAENFSGAAKVLDLSYNNFRNLSFLSHFKGLHTLILDRNTDLDETTLPYLPNVEILWINNCNITNIPKWIYRIQTQCPKLQHLSMMGNPGARTLLNGGTSNENNDYRTFVFRILQNLQYLDGMSRSGPTLECTQKPQLKRTFVRREEREHLKRKEISSSFRDLFRFRKTTQSYNSSSN